MPAIVAFVGLSNSGKTTLIEKIIRDLVARGYHVATVKHAGGHGTHLDEPGKDTYRHVQAGSEATAVLSGDRVMLIRPVEPDISVEEIARLFGEDPDIVLAEGFKQSAVPKIEVHRKDIGPPLKDLRKLIAIATDEPLDTPSRQFSLDDAKGLADFIEEGFIKPRGERLSLYINDQEITLTKFPREIVANIVLAVADSLKGVEGAVSSIKLFLKRKE